MVVPPRCQAIRAMSALLRPFTLVARAVRAFFKADLQLRRGERGIELVLDEPAQRKHRGQGPSAEEERAQRDLQAICHSLARLLDESPRNRAAMRHLAFIEHALHKKGLRALHKVPYDALKRAHDQLEGMVVNWSDAGLATLRSKMAVTLMEREPESTGAPVAVPAGDEPTPSVMETAPLAHPVALEGDDAAEAEAALRAAYGEVALTGLELVPDADEPAVSMHGELSSPSAKALAKAARRPSETAV